ncbi:hypothetical protein ABH917_002477 [Thermobifida halotolerans]
MLLAAAAGTVAGLNRTTGPALDDAENFRTHLVTVAVESGLAASAARPPGGRGAPKRSGGDRKRPEPRARAAPCTAGRVSRRCR